MSTSEPRLTFVGTATTIMRLGGFTLLTDPNFLHWGPVVTTTHAARRLPAGVQRGQTVELAPRGQISAVSLRSAGKD